MITVEGWVWCSKYGEVHADSLNPYGYIEDGKQDCCLPTNHQPLLTGTVWELTFYDSDADDNRGWTKSMGVYHHRENAQREADKNNAEILDCYNRDAQRRYLEQLRRAVEHNALVEAGIRSQLHMAIPDQPTPITARPTCLNRHDAGRHEVGDWWEVGPFEFDWNDAE